MDAERQYVKRQTGIGLIRLGLTGSMARLRWLLWNMSRRWRCIRRWSFIHPNRVPWVQKPVRGTRSRCTVTLGTLTVGRRLQLIFSGKCIIWWWHVEVREGWRWGQRCSSLLYGQIITLSLTHLMEVGPSSHNHNLSITWCSQVSCQLSLCGSVPAHIEQDLNNDEYNYNYVPVQLHYSEITERGLS